MSGSNRLSHFPALDGLRGLAVAAVLAFHAGLSGGRGGFLGVSAFFTLSGFLITSLFLAELDATGQIRLRAFWARRARRLLPASYAALLLIAAFGRFAADGDQLRSLRSDAVSALCYVANWRFLFDGRSYAQLFAAPSPVQHFWSLAIEEQLYVVLPLVVTAMLLLGRARRRAWIAGGFTVALAASIVTTLVLSDQDRIYYGTDTRAAELLAGALLAVALSGRIPLAPGRLRRVVVAAGAPALAAMLAMWALTGQSSSWLYQGGLAGHALLATVVIAAAVHDGPVGRLLSLPPLRGLGRVSYGVYLFHWPVFLWIESDRSGVAALPTLGLRLAVTLALAAASYRWLEQPIRTGRRVTGWRPLVALPAAVAVVTAAVLAVSTNPPAPAIVLEPVTLTPPPAVSGKASHASGPVVPAAGEGSDGLLHRPLETDRPLRVLVVGDSVALTLGRGFERRATDVGDVQAWNLARMWCGIGRYADRLMMGVRKESEGCSDWGERWADAVERFDPDTVVVLSTIWELAERRLPEWPDFLAIGDPAYDEWIASEYREAVDVLSARGARVVWLTTPCFRDASSEQRAQVAHLDSDILPRVARTRPDAMHIVDLDAHICPGGEFSGRIDSTDGARPDGLHFSDPGADAVASWLVPMLRSDEPPETDVSANAGTASSP